MKLKVLINDQKSSIKLLLFILLIGLAIAENLDAVAISGISLRRVLQFFIISFGSALFFRALIDSRRSINLRRYLIKDINLIIILTILVWGIFLTLHNCGGEIYQCLQNKFYISRLIHWILIISVLVLSYFASINSSIVHVEAIILKLTSLTAVIVIIYIIDYSLVRYGIDILYRNNIGTSGGEVLNRFSYYEFHRLMGWFREPSHAASFLIIVLALTFAEKNISKKIIIITGLMLTGSFIVYIMLAIVLFFWLMYSLNAGSANHIKPMLVAVFLGSLLAHAISFRYDAEPVSPQQELYIEKRISLITNELALCQLDGDKLKYIRCKLENIPGRGYVFSYLFDNPPGYLGLGLFAPYLDLKKYKDIEIIPSFLTSLVMAYQFGIVPVAILLCIFFMIIFTLAGRNAEYAHINLSSALVVTFLVLTLLIEEPNLFMISIIGVSMGVLRSYKENPVTSLKY